MMSTPSTTSRFRVEASARCESTTAGRRFAKVPRPALRFSSPFSGLCSGGRASHLYLKASEPLYTARRLSVGRILQLGLGSCLYPPIAANSTASEVLQICRVSSGRGEPVASMAAPPMRASVKSKLTPSMSPATFRRSTATLEISGPMPSPDSTAILQTRQVTRPFREPSRRGVRAVFLNWDKVLVCVTLKESNCFMTAAGMGVMRDACDREDVQLLCKQRAQIAQTMLRSPKSDFKERKSLCVSVRGAGTP